MTQCQVCGCHLDEDVVSCVLCSTAHHDDCAKWARQCSTFGCGSSKFRSGNEILDHTAVIADEKHPASEVQDSNDRVSPTKQSRSRVYACMDKSGGARSTPSVIVRCVVVPAMLIAIGLGYKGFAGVSLLALLIWKIVDALRALDSWCWCEIDRNTRKMTLYLTEESVYDVDSISFDEIRCVSIEPGLLSDSQDSAYVTLDLSGSRKLHLRVPRSATQGTGRSRWAGRLARLIGIPFVSGEGRLLSQ